LEFCSAEVGADVQDKSGFKPPDQKKPVRVFLSIYIKQLERPPAEESERTATAFLLYPLTHFLETFSLSAASSLEDSALLGELLAALRGVEPEEGCSCSTETPSRFFT